MSRNEQARRSEVSFPDAKRVGEHLVIEKTQWVPGARPESCAAPRPRDGYVEGYFYCLQCGAERLSRREFAGVCPDPAVDGASTDVEGGAE